MRLLCSWMCRAHCHRVIKLSGTLQVLAPEKELVENVHGVRSTFLSIGKELREKLESESDIGVFGPEAPPSVYFIGKLLWSKGIGSLMDLIKYAEETADLVIDLDMYGGGPDAEEAEAKSRKLGLDMKFHGPIDHASLAHSHKVSDEEDIYQSFHVGSFMHYCSRSVGNGEIRHSAFAPFERLLCAISQLSAIYIERGVRSHVILCLDPLT